MKKIMILLIIASLAAFMLSGAVSATEKISKNKNQGNSNGDSESSSQSVSADGRYVTFASPATDIVSGDANGAWSDVFVRDTVTKKTQRVNYKKDGNQPNAHGYDPVISANGRYVAYYTQYDMGFNTPGVFQIYLYDRVSQSTELVSKATNKEPGNSHSTSPSISADGRYVAFQSDASNLFDSEYETNNFIDNNPGASDIFVRDRQNGITRRISLSSAGKNANDASWNPQISADGRYVTFESDASNLVSGTDLGGDSDIFVRDLWNDVTKRIMGITGAEPNGDSYASSISANGQYVSFVSKATNLVANDNNGLNDVFVANMFSPGNPSITRVSVSSSEKQATGGPSTFAAISADGRYIAFQSEATNLVSGDTNGKIDIFIRDRVAGNTKRISVSSTGTQANDISFKSYTSGPSISGNGKYVVFNSKATNLVYGDTNKWDVFINTVDFAGPVVKSTNPKKKARKVKRSSNIYIYFNEKIRINSSSKIILKNKKGKVIKARKTVSGNKLTINPQPKLSKNTRYTVTILNSAVSDFANNYNLNTKKYVYQFTTGRR